MTLCKPRIILIHLDTSWYILIYLDILYELARQRPQECHEDLSHGHRVIPAKALRIPRWARDHWHSAAPSGRRGHHTWHGFDRRLQLWWGWPPSNSFWNGSLQRWCNLSFPFKSSPQLHKLQISLMCRAQTAQSSSHSSRAAPLARDTEVSNHHPQLPHKTLWDPIFLSANLATK